MTSFFFPTEIINVVKNQQQINQFLKKQSIRQGVSIEFRTCLIREMYLYAKCKKNGCKAKISYKRREQNDDYHIWRDNREHQHSFSKQILNGQIQEFIKDLPLSINCQTAKKIVIDKFKISKAKFYYQYRKVCNQKVSYKGLIDFLDQMNCEIRSEPFSENTTQLPELFLVVTPKMKQNFHKFGNWVGFDFTFNLIQENHNNGKNWKTGCFMGISNSRKMVPFALVLSTSETEERFYQIFKSFFDIMKKEPAVIISDEDTALIAALRSLKLDDQFQGVHLLDCFHILRNVKKNLHDKQYWDLFRQLLYAQTKDQFEQKLNKALMAIENQGDMRILQRFVDGGKQYIFSQVPKVFFGFLPNTSMNQKVHDLLKNIIPYSKSFTVVVQKAVSYLEELGEKCQQYELESLKFQKFYNFPSLKELRFLVCKQMMERIIKQLSKSILYELNWLEENIYEVIDSSLRFLVKKREQKWICDCEYLEKTGIVCSHLLRVLLVQRKRIIPYISPHWLITQKSSKIARFQRKTRRNMIK